MKINSPKNILYNLIISHALTCKKMDISDINPSVKKEREKKKNPS